MDHTEEPRLFVELSHWNRLTEARHELRIIRAEQRADLGVCGGDRSYVAYCPCGGFALEAGSLDFLSWSYRKHINERSSADLPTCPKCAEMVHDADCPLVGDGRPVDGDAPDA